MKTTAYLRSAALIVATFSVGLYGLGAESNAPDTRNQAIVQTPRYLEDHPELLRGQMTRETLRDRDQRRKAYLEKLSCNRALAASPRFLEDHPEWLRCQTSRKETAITNDIRQDRVKNIRKNSALAASPRLKEEYPELRFKMAN